MVKATKDSESVSSRSFTVLKPFMHRGEPVEEGSVIDDLPVGSIGELIHTGKIKPMTADSKSKR